eukprot:Opistho-1_new@30585
MAAAMLWYMPLCARNVSSASWRDLSLVNSARYRGRTYFMRPCEVTNATTCGNTTFAGQTACAHHTSGQGTRAHLRVDGLPLGLDAQLLPAKLDLGVVVRVHAVERLHRSAVRGREGCRSAIANSAQAEFLRGRAHSSCMTESSQTRDGCDG